MEPALSSPKTINNNTMSFDDVAKEVIKNSIRSAICIDDAYASAYSNDTDPKLNYEEPRKLYNSFRETGQCDLDIYQFKTLQDSWKKEYMIPNKDLMILDWELDQNTEPKYLDTLQILADVISSSQIPFVVVYTNANDLNKVSRILLSQFNLVDKGYEVDQIINSLNEVFDRMPHGDSDVDFETFLEEPEILELFFEYLFFYQRKAEIKDSILNKVKSEMGLEKVNNRGVCAAIAKSLKDKVPGEKDYIKTLALIALNQNDKQVSGSFNIERVEADKPIFKINNTTVLIYHKSENGDGVKPENLFDVFSKAIIANPHNYLSLLSLELKDQLRKEFSKIGSRFSEINEKAFFYHMLNFKDKSKDTFNKRGIYDFVIKSWMQDLIAQTLDCKSEVVGLIDEGFRRAGEIPTEIENSLQDDLTKYSAFISTSYLKSSDKKIKFGDIFKNKTADDYFLCITPHCDCVNPEEKIKSNFYFIKGWVIKNTDDIKTAINKAEQEYYSFLNIENQAICIDWSCKPFTAYIPNNNIEELSIAYLDKKLTLDYITTLKENFAQRISNESFGYGYRVGIDLPH